MVTSVLGYTAYDKIGSIGANDPQYQSIMATTYQYDVLYRLKTTQSASTRSIFFGGVEFMQFSNQFAEKLTYDANGNITTLKRYKADGTNLRDNLTYYYNKNNVATLPTPTGGIAGTLTNNRLLTVTDDQGGDIAIGYKPATTADQTAVGLASGVTYAYDLQGRLIKDASKQISSITWTAFNKVETITRTSTTKPSLSFKYDAFGHRIYKKVDYPASVATVDYEEWYILDASGTEITSYKKLSTETNAVPQQIHIFAASRVGYYKTDNRPLTTDNQFFEITDYQGSVRAVVTGTKDAYGNAQIVSLTDYYAFGSVARKYVSQAESQQYGFHGMKRDNQVGNDDEDYTTEFRQYDSDLGRWLTPDPLMAMFPDWSPYNFNYNNPVNFTDPEGLAPNGDGVTYDESSAKGYNTGNGGEAGKVQPNGTQKSGGTESKSWASSLLQGLKSVVQSCVNFALKSLIITNPFKAARNYEEKAPILTNAVNSAKGQLDGALAHITFGMVNSQRKSNQAYNNGRDFIDKNPWIVDIAVVLLTKRPGGNGGGLSPATSTGGYVPSILSTGKFTIVEIKTSAQVYASAESQKESTHNNTGDGDEPGEINIPEKDKIPRDQLDPPSKPGDAPTFKSDGSPVEIHHVNQNPKGPFKEMHWRDHRGKGNYKKYHPQRGKSKIDRPKFDKQKDQYWRSQYPDVK